MSGRKLSLVLFDLDGTLVDSQRDLAASINHVRSSRDMPPLELEAVRSYVGDGVRMLVRRALPGLSESELNSAVNSLKDYYREHLLDTTKLYPGIREMLERLGTLPKAVLTNKPEEFSKKILEGLGTASRFRLVWGGDTGERKKPDPLPVRKILEHFGCRTEEAVLVGDGINDIKAAKAAGIRSFAVGYGYTDKDTLLKLQPDYFAATPDEIVPKLADFR